MNSLEKIVDLLAAVCLMFLIPFLYYGGAKLVSGVMMAGQAGETFLNRISTAGEITLPVWKELETVLESAGCEYFEIQRERSLFEPGSEKGTVVENIYVDSTEIVEGKVKQEGCYRLQKGDKIKLTFYMNEVPAVFYGTVRTGATEG